MNGEQTWVKDPDLVEIYDQVDVDTTPAPPPLEAVAIRIAQRRRRRRGTALVGSAAVIAAVAAAAAGIGGGGQDRDVATEPPPDLLTVTEADGSTFTFSDFTIACETDEQGRELILVSSGPVETDGALKAPIFYLSMAVENGDGPAEFYPIPPKGEPVQGLDLPPGIPTPTEVPFSLFVATEERPGGNNEVTSGESGAAGTFEVGGAACGKDPSINFMVEGTLGSEVDQPPLDIAGQVSLG